MNSQTIARGGEDGPMHYCPRPKAEGNNASGRPRHRGAIVLTIHQTFHEITVLLPNQHVTVLTNRYEISIH